jgi:hypothetical protein
VAGVRIACCLLGDLLEGITCTKVEPSSSMSEPLSLRRASSIVVRGSWAVAALLNAGALLVVAPGSLQAARDLSRLARMDGGGSDMRDMSLPRLKLDASVCSSSGAPWLFSAPSVRCERRLFASSASNLPLFHANL